jgi:acetyl esterase
MQRYWDWYLPDGEVRRDALAAPLRTSNKALAALPPIGLIAAGVDPLLSDSLNLGARLVIDVGVVPGVGHGFLQMSRDLPQVRAALSEGAAFIRNHT